MSATPTGSRDAGGREQLLRRAATAADRERQAALYDLCFAKDDGARTVPWRYDQNPHGEAITRIATDPAGQVVSHYACSPRRVSFPLGGGPGRRGEATVGQTGDVMTHPEFRKLGIFSDLDRDAMEEARERGWPVVFGLPNRQSAHIFTRDLGWEAVGTIRPWTFVLVADARARLERLRAGRLAAAGVRWAAWRGLMRRGALRRASHGQVNVVPLPRLGEEAQALFEMVAQDYPWMVRRDPEYLNWRFSDAPSGRFRTHAAFDGEGKLVGYCVVQLPLQDEAAGHLVELVGRDEVAHSALLEAALGHLAKAGAAVARAHAIAGSRWERQLRSAGFRAPKREDGKIVIVRVLDERHPLAAIARRPAEWFFTDGDRDDELVR